ncbi:hypothetical protein BJ742DRAFT_675162, partial [Cladochytrium replicatum]
CNFVSLAASKCRQKKKQWLNDLQTKVETFGEANRMLTKEAEKLLEEVRFLKALLLQHSSCKLHRRMNSFGSEIDEFRA